MAEEPIIHVEGLRKRFVLHAQGGAVLDVLDGFALEVAAGTCVALHGPSGAGKSSVLRCLYGNYRADAGRILIRHDGGMIDIASAGPQAVLAVRRRTLGFVSQFLRAVPRVPAIDVVAEPVRLRGVDVRGARDRAASMLARLNVPERLWSLAPATFSGGEQQRVNVARGLVADFPAMLLDEPTSALDAENRAAVVDLIRERIAAGMAIVGIFHDAEVRAALATRVCIMTVGESRHDG